MYQKYSRFSPILNVLEVLSFLTNSQCTRSTLIYHQFSAVDFKQNARFLLILSSGFQIKLSFLTNSQQWISNKTLISHQFSAVDSKQNARFLPILDVPEVLSFLTNSQCTRSTLIYHQFSAVDFKQNARFLLILSSGFQTKLSFLTNSQQWISNKTLISHQFSAVDFKQNTHFSPILSSGFQTKH